MAASGLIWDLLARDQASPTFLKVAGAADKAAASTARAQKGVQNWTAASAKAGAALTKKLTLPIAALGAVAVDQAAKYQKALNTIQVATGRTAAEMQQASKGLLQISSQTATSTSSLTDAFYTASKAGLSVAQSLAVTKAAAQGAKAENADLGTVTDALTSVMASYGKSLGSPTQAMNAIIRGAGLAKTNLADFAGSLSNVVPIASSLHISFAQVAGAIDTMTQHGETAQRATDNLSNLITNLAGQNNVASKSLQQLGVNTISLSANLGKKGLTGSLQTVLDAIDKNMGPAGLVVTSAFKKAATATQSLQTELKSMPKTMQANSQAFANGTMNYKDYLAYAKSLGGQQYAMAKQFIGTEQAAQGFNDQLKSGNSTTKTVAATLQKALGGVTGMRVALMLSGASAKTFATDTKAVGDASKAAGKDVLGFGDTQKTAAYKADAAKVAFQNLAIKLGTALLPAASKLADAGTKILGWIDGLSGGQKKFLAWSLGIAAAIGPVLAISAKLALVGRGITTFVTGAVAQLSRFSTTLALNSTEVATGMSRIGAALGGAAIGVAVGSFTRNASTTTKWLGALGSAAGGAAIGFGTGGPVGALIGGLAGGVSALATSFIGMGNKAKSASQVAAEALASQNKVAHDLYATLQSVNGAYNEQYKTAVAQQIQSKGGFTAGKAAGLSQSDVLQAALGNQKVLAQINAAYTKLQSQTVTDVPDGHGGTMQVGNPKVLAQINALQKLLDILGIVTPGAAKAESKLDDVNAAIGKGVVSTKLLATGYKGLAKEFATSGTTLDKTTAYGLRNNEIIKENILYAQKQAAAQQQAGKDIASVAGSYDKQISSMRSTLLQMGFNQSAVDKLIGTYGKIPKSLKTNLDVVGLTPADIQAYIDKYHKIPTSWVTVLEAKDHSTATIQAIKSELAGLKNKTVLVNVKQGTTYVAPGQSARSQFGHTGMTVHRAGGGSIDGPSGTVSGHGPSTVDSVPAMLAPGEEVIRASQAKKWRGLLKAINGGVAGFATGGTVGVTHSGKDWIYRGIKYASERAAENARTRYENSKSSTAQSSLLSGVNTKIGDVGSAPAGPKFSVADVGITRINAQINAAKTALDKAISQGLDKKYVGALEQRIRDMGKLAQTQLGQLRLKVKSSDLKSLRAALKGTVDDTKAALSTLYTDLSHEGASKATIARARSLGSQLTSGQNTLTNMKSYQSGIKSTLAGQFDSTQYGSVNDLVSGLTGATGQNNAYASELTKLRGESKGNKTLTAYINQLAASGQTATLQTLAGASKGQLAQVSKAVGSYNSSLTAGSSAATVSEYGKTVAQQTKNVDKLEAAVEKLAVAVGNHALSQSKSTEKALESALKGLTAAKKTR